MTDRDVGDWSHPQRATLVRLTPLDGGRRPLPAAALAAEAFLTAGYRPRLREVDSEVVVESFEVRVRFEGVEKGIADAVRRTVTGCVMIAVELWSRVPVILRETGIHGGYGYLLFAQVSAPALGDVITDPDDGTVSFTLTGRTEGGSRWGTGPHPDAVLPDPVEETDHLYVRLTDGVPAT